MLDVLLRVRAAVEREYDPRLAVPIARRSDRLGPLVRHPRLWDRPADRRTLHVWRPTALGDVLLATPALRRLKQVAPRTRLVFHTAYPELVRGLPFVDAVGDPTPPAGAIFLGYEHVARPTRHLARVMGDALGVWVRDVRPACALDENLVAHFRAAWAHLPRPWVVVSRRAGPWTPNKDWPAAHWAELADRLRGRVSLIDLGAATEDAGLPGVAADLRGRTTVPELVAAVAAADLHVGPISGPVHIAAAVRTPSVVIYGGYEPPACTRYPGNVALVGRPPCSPCWLRTDCPFGRPCLTAIRPAVVAAAVERLWPGVGG